MIRGDTIWLNKRHVEKENKLQKNYGCFPKKY